MNRLRIAVAIASLAVVLPQIHPVAAGAAAARRGAERQRWSDPQTWNGAPPRAGETVVVPRGAHVVLDTSPPALGGLQVDGRLTFARKDLALSADWIVVHGTLRVGSETRPFRHDAVITLTGDDQTQDVMGMGTKVLGVMGGTLELHGRPRPGWTRLDATVEPGSATLVLARAMPWERGDRIVVASSDYWRHHDEERTVTSVHGRTVTLDAPLQYRHWGEIQTFGGEAVDERAEVGLLTRNVVVRGDSSSGDSGFGGHMMAMAGSVVRIDGVELDRMGQRLALRRYPVHFHMEGDGSGSYVQRSSIHHSFNRCVVVHGTNGLLLRDNVCYEHLGHGYFLEDGAESDNVFAHNLGLGTVKVEDGLLPSDERPATFWITNPDNVLRNNAAAGSDGTGFWYALPRQPTGMSSSASSISPRETPLGVFRDNVAHSNRIHGLDVDHGPTETGEIEVAPYTPPAVARFTGLTSYMNRDRGVWLRGRDLRVVDAVLADNKTGATFAAAESFLEQSLVVGETANPGMTEPWEKARPDGRALPANWQPDSVIGGFELYDGRVGVRDTTFAEFTPNATRPAGALTYLAPNRFRVDPRNFTEGVRFLDANRVYFSQPAAGMDGDASAVAVDRDGSVTGTAGAAIVANNPFLLTEGCRYVAGWNAHVCPSDFVTLTVDTLDTGQAPWPLELSPPAGDVQTLAGCCAGIRYVSTTIVPGRTYRATFDGAMPPQTKLVLVNGTGRWVRLAIPVEEPLRVTRWRAPLTPVADQAALDALRASGYHYDSARGLLHVKLFGETDYEEIRVESR